MQATDKRNFFADLIRRMVGHGSLRIGVDDQVAVVVLTAMEVETLLRLAGAGKQLDKYFK